MTYRIFVEIGRLPVRRFSVAPLNNIARDAIVRD